MFRIEVLPAGHGDCLWVEYGSRSSKHRMLIDGGPYTAFDVLQDRIDKLKPKNRHLDLMIVTHIDADHIEGIVKVLGNLPPDLKIDDIWFNAWRHLSVQPKDLLGPVQGEYLSSLILEKKFDWNKAFGKGPVVIGDTDNLPMVALNGGLQITLLSPTWTANTKLRRVWKREVRKAGLDPNSPQEALKRLKEDRRLKPSDLLGERKPNVRNLAEISFDRDDSVANGSSIAFLADFEGKRYLFAGDAHPSVLETSIKHLLKKTKKTRLKVDIMKVSHHGSKGNISPALLKMLECKRFLISTDGSYFSHPDEEAIARIISLSGPDTQLLFNYRSDENRVWDDPTLMRRHRYKAIYPPPRQKGLSVEL